MRKIIYASAFLFSFFAGNAALAQFQAGPLSPSASSNGNCSFAYGSSLNLAPGANVYASDNQYATASHCACCDANTSCLQVSGFGFSIPLTATITGITVEIEKRGSIGSNIQDNGLRLLKGGVQVGSNLANFGSAWPTTDTYTSYGGCANLWGETWTPADINATDFGLTFASIDYTCGGVTTSYIDHIRITVCYDDCMSSVISSFSNNSAELVVSFSDLSSGMPNSWEWDFGDGNTSTQQNPTHTYADTGSYMVCLIASDACGSDTTCTMIDVCRDPQAGFTFQSNGLTVNFTDISTYSASSLWDFGDGNVDVVPNPVHTFSDTGTYNVCMIAVNACGGTDTACTQIQVCRIPVAAFTSLVAGSNVSFADASTDADTWAWNFGDGNTSTLPNPSHAYTNPGTYQVCLVAGNACYMDTTCADVTIQGLAINGADQMTDVQMFPNPVKETLYFAVPETMTGKEVSVILYDYQGKVVLQKLLVWNSGMAEINVASFPAGVYTISLVSAELNISKKIVLQK